MENWKELYEIEKRQRLNTEAAMKEIVNGLCLSAFTISEDSKMQLLKTDMQRIQQEIARLEANKQQRLQQHLLSVGGMIQQMTSAGNPLYSTQGTQGANRGVTNNVNNRMMLANQYMPNNQRPQSAFTSFQNPGLSGIDTQRLSAALNTGNNLRAQPAMDTAKFQKPRAQPRAPRRKRAAAAVEESFRPNSAVPQQTVVAATPVIPCNRALSAEPPNVTNFTPKPAFVELSESPIDGHGINNKNDNSSEQGSNNKSQVEDDIIFTEAIPPNPFTVEKNKFFCDFCTTPTDENETVAHIWKHVNEIKRMHAFECVIKDCDFKTNVMKTALAHKKTGHPIEDNCKILDRRDSLNEYFKHCINKYFVRLDDETKEKIFDSRYS